MRKKHNIRHIWLILAAYGVFFAMFSGFEELSHGKYWKVIASLTLGAIVYFIIESREKR